MSNINKLVNRQSRIYSTHKIKVILLKLEKSFTVLVMQLELKGVHDKHQERMDSDI